MRPLDQFENYLKQGIVKKQSPNKLRANALLKEIGKSHDSLMEIISKIGINEVNANHIIKNAYDIIMELIRSKMHLQGYKSFGQGAHEAEVSYLRELNFPDSEIQFVNQLRYFRNSITYYGEQFDKEYAQKVIDFLNKIMPRLK